MFQSYQYILVVDDHAGIRHVLFEFFSDRGYNVETASNGIEAIQKVKNRVPSIILLDLRMPGMSGLETLIELQKISPNVAVVMVSAYSDQNALKDAIQTGLVKFHVQKPFDLHVLLNVVDSIISEGMAETNSQRLKLEG